MAAMENTALEKLDPYREHHAEYAATKHPTLVTIAPAHYLTIDGMGEPGGEIFQERLAVLYGVAFTMKMARKRAGQDYAVCKLEGLWVIPESADWKERRGEWRWKLMIRTPDFVNREDLRGAVETLKRKGKDVGSGEVKLERIDEGACVQALHVGPYTTEERTLGEMKAVVDDAGLAMVGPHHEIYLSDPRRVDPEKVRTILRYPVR